MVASDSIIPKGLISDENSNLPTFILGFYLFKYTPNEYPNFSAFMLQYVFFLISFCFLAENLQMLKI